MKRNIYLTLLLFPVFALLHAQDLEVDNKVKVLQMDTVLAATANVVRISDGTFALREYKVGDLAHGGIIFWVDETGKHGLVSSLNDLKSPTGQFTHQWSRSFDEWTGSTGEGVGGGVMNTMLMLSAQREDPDSVARLSTDLIEEGYGDWYLPSREELNMMYENLQLANLGNFAASIYWSSSEFDDFTARVQEFPQGFQSIDGKFLRYRARAIRAFKFYKLRQEV